MTISPKTPASTILAIVVLSAFCLLPLIFYLRIVLKFLLDKDLQAELKGKESTLAIAKGATSRVAKPVKVLLTFRNVSYTVKSSGKEIVKKVSGYFAPHTLTAILGTSGCGKTTLLTVLADQVDITGEATGSIYVNGKEKNDAYRRMCAYVMQSDNLLECLTVREALWFTAELRLGAFSNAEKMEVVRTVIRDLDLAAAADRRISVLSGGQKRRVTVATELVAMPSLVFLDEPTTGLDASASLKLVRVLRKLADSGRTIVCTIHQPRVDAFKLFHMVFLMNAGQLLYFGPETKIVDYFTELGRRNAMKQRHSHESIRQLLYQQEGNEEEINPADFVLDFTHGKSDEVIAYCEDFAHSDVFIMLLNTVDEINSGKCEAGSSFCFMKNDPEWFPELHVMPVSDSTLPHPLDQAILGESEHESGCATSGCIDPTCGSPTAEKTCACCCRPYSAMTKYASTNLKQTFTLIRRALISSTRNQAYIMSWVLGIVMMLFMGMLYSAVQQPLLSNQQLSQINNNLASWGACTQNLTTIGAILNVTSDQANQTIWQCGDDLNRSWQLGLARTSLLYQLLASMFFSEMPIVASIHADRNLYVREHSSRAYSSLAWTLSWICRIAFSGIVKGIVFPPFVYFSARLAISTEAYFLFCIFMGTMSIMGASMALLVTVVFSSFETASVAFVVINIVSQNLCGYFISDNFIPWWFRWIFYTNFFRYTFEGTVLGQYLGPNSLASATAENRLGTYLQIQNYAWWWAFIAVMFCILIQLIAFIIVQVTGSAAGCRGLRGRPNEGSLKFSPVQLGGGFALTTFARTEVITSTTTIQSPVPEASPPTQ